MTIDRNVLVVGYGAVSQCTLPVLLDNIDIDPRKITVVDFEDKQNQIQDLRKRGVRFVQRKISPDNLEHTLREFGKENGIVIDLAWNIGATDILSAAANLNQLYVNTSVELWDPYSQQTVFDKTLFYRQKQLEQLKRKWENNAPTAIVDHGANPGLISHFVRKGLYDIAEKLIERGMVSDVIRHKLTSYMALQDYANLSRELGVKVIHCSERDTQVTNRPKQVDEFVNTWSVEGFFEEGQAPAEMGWGTHERTIPENAFSPIEYPENERNQIFLAQMGINTRVKSFVPEIGPIEGMIVRHGEAYGLSSRLAVIENGKVIYRPTVHYAYMPCHEALASLDELRSRNYRLQEKTRIMTDEITSGKDILGALLMGHRFNSWWTGSILSIEEARRLAPGQNATTLQVAAGVVSAVKYALDNPKKGILLPDDIPHTYILNIARPYLGELHSKPYDWTPIKDRRVFFNENPKSRINESDPWQFECFRPLP